MSTATQKKRGFNMSLMLDYQYTEKYTKTGKLVKNCISQVQTFKKSNKN